MENYVFDDICSNKKLQGWLRPSLRLFIKQLFENREKLAIFLAFFEKKIDFLIGKHYTVSKWSKRVVKWSKMEWR